MRVSLALISNAVFACSMIITSSATLAAIIDQEYDPTGSSQVLIVDVDNDLAQTFTVGITGTLSSIDLMIDSFNATDDLLVDFRRTTLSGSPVESDTGSDILGSFAVAANTITALGAITFKNYDVSSLGIAVTAGEILAITLTSSESTGRFRWATKTSAGYSGGDGYLRGSDIGSTTWTTFAGSDHGFRTYIQPVPVPAAIWLFGSGLLGIVGIARRKKA